MVGLPDSMEDFLNYLLVWPWFPVVWLDKDPNRTRAPLFVVARYGRRKARHTCYFQFGCRYCRHQTELLFPAGGAMWRQLAEQQMMNFFEPLLRKYLSQRVPKSLTLSPPLTASRRASQPVEQNLSSENEAPQPVEQFPQRPSKRARYKDPDTDCLLWHNDGTGEFFFAATGTSRRPETATFNKPLDKEPKRAQDEEGGSTDAGDSCTCDTVTDVDSISTASSACPQAQAMPTGRPGPGFKGLCTHRTYAMNLYTPGQLPVYR